MERTTQTGRLRALLAAALLAAPFAQSLSAQSCFDYRQTTAGNEFSLALRSDGQIAAFGYNGFGTLNVPSLSAGATYVEVAAGGSSSNFAIARRNDGSLVGWGNNSSGQTNVPTAGSPYQQVAAGMTHALARTSSSTVVAWGSNTQGQATVPAILNGVACIDLAAGWYHSIALHSDGTVTGWGNNTYGQCVLPALASGLTYVEVAAGAYFTIGRVSDGTLRAVGENNNGQCNVPLGGGFVQIAAGRDFALARHLNGTILGWGSGVNGQITVPALPAGVVYTDVAAGGYHSLACRSDGACMAFGYNSWGQSNAPALPSCSCDGSLVTNGRFTIGLVPGSMPQASIANWSMLTQSPQVVESDGASGLGCMQLWGNQVVGESIIQSLATPIVAGRTYRLSLSYRWLNNSSILPQYVRFRITASTGPFAYPPAMGASIGITPNTSSQSWTSWTTTWTAPANATHISINPENDFTVNDGNYVSWGRIDDICLRETGNADTFGPGCYASNAPVLAPSVLPNLNTPVDLVTSNLQPGVLLGLQILAMAPYTPGIELTPAGMPGCHLHVPLEVTNLWLAQGGLGHYLLTIPDNASLVGIHVYSQSLVFTPGANSFGGLMSNALDLTIGW
jgi:alpha-tubulin suppressor-like RCC1 family protein